MFKHTFLDGIGATNDGSWVNTNKLTNMTIHVKGITNATVQIRGSNATAKPADTGHEIQIGTDITADTIREVINVGWVKVMISAWVGGTIYALLDADWATG